MTEKPDEEERNSLLKSNEPSKLYEMKDRPSILTDATDIEESRGISFIKVEEVKAQELSPRLEEIVEKENAEQ